MNWIHYMWFAYVWPSLKGNGPEDIVHLLLFAIAGTIIYPPTRKWFGREWNHVHAKLDHIIESHPHPEGKKPPAKGSAPK